MGNAGDSERSNSRKTPIKSKQNNVLNAHKKAFLIFIYWPIFFNEVINSEYYRKN